MSGQYKVAWLCEALLVSRSGYYHWAERRRQPSARQLDNIHLRERIRAEFARSRQTYGSPRLARALGCPGRRNRIARLMRTERIFARQRSKYRPKTTDSQHGGPIAPNRLPKLTVHRPDQAWVTDATCILTGQGWLYLVAVLDIHTRRVVGWAMHHEDKKGVSAGISTVFFMLLHRQADFLVPAPILLQPSPHSNNG
jgi:putative transposase